MKRIVFLSIALFIYTFSFSCSKEPQVGDDCKKDRAHLCVNGTFYFCDEADGESKIVSSDSCSSICPKYQYPYENWVFEGHCSQDISSPSYTTYGCCTCFNEELGYTNCVIKTPEGIVLSLN